MNSQTTIVLSLGRSEDLQCRTLEKQLVEALQRRPHQLVVVPHLYDLAPRGPASEHLRTIQGPLIVLSWFYPRASYWVLRANGVQGRFGGPAPPPQEVCRNGEPATEGAEARSIWCFDLRDHGQPAQLLAEIERIAAGADGRALTAADAPAQRGKLLRIDEETRFRWYPVIDYDRCQNCQECLNFCLFGVLGVDTQGEVFVEQPDACRNGCPACSRVCPSRAIIFPQHHTPVIAGDPDAPADGFQLELVQLLGPQPFGGPTSADLAAAERARALAESRGKPPHDALDNLVDEVEKLDL